MKYLLFLLGIILTQESFSSLNNKHLNVSTSMNVEFLTTFPAGEKVGYDINTKKVINTFKMKNCGNCYCLEADPETGEVEERHKILDINDLFPGKYHVVFYPKISEEKEIRIVLNNTKLIRPDFTIGYLFLWTYKASFKKGISFHIMFEVKNHDNNSIEVFVKDEKGLPIKGSVLKKYRGPQVIQETKY